MNPQEITRARITVVGGARSGVAVSNLLKEAGADVFVTDSGLMESRFAEVLDGAEIPYESQGHSTRSLKADFLVVSPGVPDSAPIVRDAVQRGLSIYSEVEVASWFCRAPIVAVTGSNGKTTTTSLLGHIFRSADVPVYVGGNIGYPFSDFARQATPSHVVVLEVSSFQLDHVHTFRPRVSVLLNITPDHLDRYDNNFSNYAQSKFRVFENQSEEDTFVYNHDDATVRERVLRLRPERPGLRIMGFSREQELDFGAFARGDEVILRINQEEILMRTEELSLRGGHNLYNSLAAAVAARVMEVRSEIVRESLTSFEGVPHRLELVREVGGVRYVNDSKATNVNAVWYALESFSEPVVLIAGGRDKGNDYSTLKPLLREKVKAVIAIGESAAKVSEELGGEVELCYEAPSLREAVNYAHALADSGDVVLLSPACASFDMFENYEERGDVFRTLVNAL